MQRRLKALILFFALLELADTNSATSFSEEIGNAGMRERYKSSALHILGTRLVKSDGDVVQLHGINVGGWLVTEAWMCGFTDLSDTADINGNVGSVGRSTWETLQDRFGPQKTQALMRIWEDHWFTAGDLDVVRDSGFNLVRVPISYRTLQNADETWIRDASGAIDFSRMDWIVGEAAERGIYVIFDLHVWPQQRRDYQKLGRPEGAEDRDSIVRLWTTIAAHYRGNGAIAAFDLINEFPGNWGLQQTLADAVRNGDPDRILAVEGFTFAEFLRLHDAGVFPNSIFSDHIYGDAPLTTDEIVARLPDMSSSPVPVYIGEFLPADFASAIRAMDRAGVSWSPWTYKVVDGGAWGVFNYYSDLKTDIQNDSYDTIATKWSRDLTAWQNATYSPNYFINEDRRLSQPSPSTMQP